ncbi:MULTISPECIES: ArsR/SmtB family transcription factor [Paenibacillus]|jgi:DNA-binding transcriptional ArsR family regulator|uniref:ArsR/SmtB family transcription factor n=1 Tax=Paenibacillus TaxID=44249 RepID=UPI0004F596DC|nr:MULTISPECIES: metalloregulator ArsR/SmtB family transcription factor [unclassified Paenibacillus]AIQ28634.1 ArsR family transcriptional regulator [Paenibacillus sp. FSL P4-0081]OMF33456.1 transcriptional regulator [Paenibacillus sp. FSL H8-0259]
MKLDDNTLKNAVKIYKALGEPTRLKIVALLSKHEELSCSGIGEHLNFPGSTLSHHLKQLQECGLLELVRKEGTYHIYKLNQATLKNYISAEFEM